MISAVELREKKKLCRQTGFIEETLEKIEKVLEEAASHYDYPDNIIYEFDRRSATISEQVIYRLNAYGYKVDRIIPTHYYEWGAIKISW